MAEQFFYLKQVEFLGRSATIICQNENGPCPLLALANVLSLRGNLHVPSDHAVITNEDLLMIVGRWMLENNPPPQDEMQAENFQANLDSAVLKLPQLLVGLDVNVGFEHVCDFEYTEESVVFDLLAVNLYHAWVVDEQDVQTAAALGRVGSYNALVEVVATSSSPEPQQQSEDTKPDVEQLTVEDDGDRPGDATDTEVAPAPDVDASACPACEQLTVEDDGDHPGVATDTEVAPAPDVDASACPAPIHSAGDVAAMLSFYHSTLSQMTVCGLFQLSERVRERELAVFFRNNHFSTIFRLNGELYLLVTDQGYLNEASITWERMVEVDGDSSFVDGHFSSYRPGRQHTAVPVAVALPAPPPGYFATVGVPAVAQPHVAADGEDVRGIPVAAPAGGDSQCVGQTDHDADFLLALRIQQQEERQQAARRQPPPQQQRNDRSARGKHSKTNNKEPGKKNASGCTMV